VHPIDSAGSEDASSSASSCSYLVRVFCFRSQIVLAAGWLGWVACWLVCRRACSLAAVRGLVALLHACVPPCVRAPGTAAMRALVFAA